MRKFLVSADPLYRVSRTWNNVHVCQCPCGRKLTSRPAPPPPHRGPLLCSHRPSHSATWQWQAHHTAAKIGARARSQSNSWVRAKVKKEKGLTGGRSSSLKGEGGSLDFRGTSGSSTLDYGEGGPAARARPAVYIWMGWKQ